MTGVRGDQYHCFTARSPLQQLWLRMTPQIVHGLFLLSVQHFLHMGKTSEERPGSFSYLLPPVAGLLHVSPLFIQTRHLATDSQGSPPSYRCSRCKTKSEGWLGCIGRPLALERCSGLEFPSLYCRWRSTKANTFDQMVKQDFFFFPLIHSSVFVNSCKCKYRKSQSPLYILERTSFLGSCWKY